MGAAFGRPTLPHSTSQTNQNSYPAKNILPRSTYSVPSCRGMSPVVKEIEKLRKNREERRARQNEHKLEKQELMNRDAGNPNWEFSSMVQDYRLNLDYQPLQEKLSDSVNGNRITVCVRKRPLNSKELSRKDVDVVTTPNKDTIIIHEPKSKVDLTKFLDNHTFRFDCVFDENAENETVYNCTAKSLVQTIFDGGMATCFAYGQTGSGKTHTMGGEFIGKVQDYSKGIYALTAQDVFRQLNCDKYKSFHFEVSATFFEIYCGKVYDLLNNNMKLRILENGSQQIQVVGLIEERVESVDQVMNVIKQGSKARSFSHSASNDHSSRSHAVFQIIVRRWGSRKIHGKFSLIDLAGNERGVDSTANSRQGRMEGSEINKSLLALKECIRALGKKEAYLPFRASKLTQVLRDSFIGENISTCMIAMISPAMSTCEQTLNTLRYANRVKELPLHDGDLKQASSVMLVQSPRSDETVSQTNDVYGIRSLNDIEMSPNIFNLHKTLSYLQELEEEVIEYHKLLIETTNQWVITDNVLIEMTDYPDYDVEAYSLQLQTLINDKLNILNKFNEKINKFRKKLIEEETVSTSTILRRRPSRVL